MERPSARAGAIAVMALALAPIASGCAYDLNARKTAQRHNAAYATPARFASAAPGARGDRADVAHVLRVHVYATPAYVAQTVDWSRHVHALIDDANEVLAPAVDARLAIADVGTWDF